MIELTRKQALLVELETSRAEWDSLMNQLLESDLADTPITGKWALKDVTAHLLFWENRTVQWLEAARRGTEPEPSALPQDMSEDDENEWIYQYYRAQSLDDILAESRRVHEAAVNAVRAMDDHELQVKHAWLGDKSLVEALPGNSYEHYREHIKTIREQLAQKPD